MKKRLIFIFFAMFGYGYALANTENTPEASEKDSNYVYVRIEQKPQFEGGQQALLDYINKNLVYPKEAIEQKIEGKVLVSFIVNTDGSISDVEVVKSAGKLLDDEALRLVNEMPKWIPASNKGKKFRTKLTLPFNFKFN
ncbi:MAG: energy transducer TonB [Paludibacteraceae bacterium]|nr:energy transducer TonB [Paludibacteraceae bacterium]